MSATKRLRAFTATVRRPPAPALLFVSVLGWTIMAWLTAAGAAASGGAGDVGHGPHAEHATDAVTAVAGIVHAPHDVEMWAAMIVAMSPLLLLREVTHLWNGSLRRTRALSILAFACGYLPVGLVAGFVAVPVASLLTGSVWLSGATAAAVAVWHCSPLRRRALNVCHRVPRPRVFGAAARVDSWRYGVVSATACVATCGPLMVLVLLATDWHLVAMAGAAALLTAERYLPARRPQWRLPFAPPRPAHLALRDPGETQPVPARRRPVESAS